MNGVELNSDAYSGTRSEPRCGADMTQGRSVWEAGSVYHMMPNEPYTEPVTHCP